jgi:hypothetical protein
VADGVGEADDLSVAVADFETFGFEEQAATMQTPIPIRANRWAVIFIP